MPLDSNLVHATSPEATRTLRALHDHGCIRASSVSVSTRVTLIRLRLAQYTSDGHLVAIPQQLLLARLRQYASEALPGITFRIDTPNIDKYRSASRPCTSSHYLDKLT